MYDDPDKKQDDLISNTAPRSMTNNIAVVPFIPVAVSSSLIGPPDTAGVVPAPPGALWCHVAEAGSYVAVATQQEQTRGEQQGFVLSGIPPKILSYDERQGLQAEAYPAGLVMALRTTMTKFPLHIWVVDNSGSMSTSGDGHRFVGTSTANGSKNALRLVGCSRWAELQETVIYRAEKAALLEAPTIFRLLNNPGLDPKQFGVANHRDNPKRRSLQEDLNAARGTIRRTTPDGMTPLTKHVYEIREQVIEMKQQLMDAGQKVAIILATDGLPSDDYGISYDYTRSEFEASLRSLQGLPVLVVVRLCTDNEDVVEYYNYLDGQMEWSLEVLDVFSGEAKEVHRHNAWLNYALPLHRLREMGFSYKVFDLLDKRPLTLTEAKEVLLVLLFCEDKLARIPYPEIDFSGFMKKLWAIVNNEGNQWNPNWKGMTPWIDMKMLKTTYGGGRRKSSSACLIM
jgi:hypothetical protein